MQREWAAAAVGVLTNCTVETQHAVREAGGIQALLGMLSERNTDGVIVMLVAIIPYSSRVSLQRPICLAGVWVEDVFVWAGLITHPVAFAENSRGTVSIMLRNNC